MTKEKYFTGINYLIHVISGKWKASIITAIETGDYRYSTLLKHLRQVHHTQISAKVLTEQLKQLEEDGIITRKSYATMPPMVKFSLTPVGLKLSREIFRLNYLGQEIAQAPTNQKVVQLTLSAQKARLLGKKHTQYEKGTKSDL